MSDSLSAVLTECAIKAISEGHCTVNDVVSCAYRDHADVFEANSERLVLAAVRREAKRILDRFANDDDQQQLPIGDLRLPSAIAVRDADDNIRYVRSDTARWLELLAGAEERNLNVVRAQAKRKQYLDALERLRPWMENDPDCTVEEALQREAAAKQDTLL